MNLSEPQRRTLHALFAHRDSDQNARDRAMSAACRDAAPVLALYRRRLARPPGELTPAGRLLAEEMHCAGMFDDLREGQGDG